MAAIDLAGSLDGVLFGEQTREFLVERLAGRGNVLRHARAASSGRRFASANDRTLGSPSGPADTATRAGHRLGRRHEVQVNPPNGRPHNRPLSIPGDDFDPLANDCLALLKDQEQVSAGNGRPGKKPADER